MATPRFPDITDHLEIDSTAFIHPRAFVTGTVRIGAESTIWPMAVVRGDEGAIVIGDRTNIQDGCVLHADGDAFLTLGNDVTLGHGAIVHGCTIGDGVLVGMGAVVLNHAQVGAGSVIGARALVTEGMVVPPGSLVLGVPGQVRPLRPEQQARTQLPAEHYVTLGRMHRQPNQD